MAPLRDDHAGVPLADRPLHVVGRGGHDVVERRHAAVAVPALVGVGVAVFEDLVLLAGALVQVLVVEVLDAGIRPGGQPEVELEGEVAVLLRRHDVAAAAELLVLRRQREPLAVVGDPVHRAHGKRAGGDHPALLRQCLASALHREPAVERLAVPEELPALGALGLGERVRVRRRRLHDRLHADRVHDAAVVAERLGELHQVVAVVLLVLDVADAVVADVGEGGEDGGDVQLAARPLLGDVVDGVDLDVLEVDVVDAVGVVADELRGVAAAEARLVTDVEAVADARVAARDALLDRLAGREEVRNVRPVVVDAGLDVVLAHHALEDVEHRVGLDPGLLAVHLALLKRHHRDHLHPVALRERERVLDRLLVVEVDGSERVDRDAALREARLVGLDLGVGGIAGDGALDEAHVAAFERLGDVERAVERRVPHRVARHAKRVGELRGAAARARLLADEQSLDERLVRRERGGRRGGRQDQRYSLHFHFSFR